MLTGIIIQRLYFERVGTVFLDIYLCLPACHSCDGNDVMIWLSRNKINNDFSVYTGRHLMRDNVDASFLKRRCLKKKRRKYEQEHYKINLSFLSLIPLNCDCEFNQTVQVDPLIGSRQLLHLRVIVNLREVAM